MGLDMRRLIFWPGILVLVMAAACAGAWSGSTANQELVDGQRVIQHVERIVSWGPHPPGSEAQRKVGEYIVEQLRSYGLEVYTDRFQPVTPQGRLSMVNIWGELEGKSPSVIILASHYDSKYFEDFEFVGANDSGSSSALVLDLARILAQDNPVDYTLWFVFFDGEEALVEWTSTDSLYGSRRFVQMLRSRGELGRVRAMILLDMIGGKDLRLHKEAFSTSWLNDIIWSKAGEMGHSDIFDPWGSTAVQDDHIPFLEAGVAAVDLIDMNYKYWHTPEDTPDKLSPRNMEVVGNVVLASLPEIARHLSR